MLFLYIQLSVINFVHKLAAKSKTHFYNYGESLNQTSLACIVFLNTSGGKQQILYYFKNFKNLFLDNIAWFSLF